MTSGCSCVNLPAGDLFQVSGNQDGAFHMLRPLKLAIFILITSLTLAHAGQLHDGLTYARGLALDIHTPQVKRASALNLFSLAGGRDRPIVVYVHGGGWVKGNRKKVYSLPQWLNSKGYVLVAIDYRKVPATTVEGQVEDLARSVQWLRRNARLYGGDPNRIVLMGHSAGAHLVALCEARKLCGRVRGVIPNDVQAYDMVAYAGMRGSLGYPYLDAFGSNPQNWVRWSPVTYARQGSGYAPHLFLHSGSNGARRRALTNGYANILRARGTSVAVFDGGRYTHGSIARKLGQPGDPATVAIERFLAQVTR